MSYKYIILFHSVWQGVQPCLLLHRNTTFCACMSTKIKQEPIMHMRFSWFSLFLHCWTRWVLLAAPDSLHNVNRCQHTFKDRIESRNNKSVTYFVTPFLIWVPKLVPFPLVWFLLVVPPFVVLPLVPFPFVIPPLVPFPFVMPPIEILIFVWIPKVAHIQGHLIFKLIILRYWLIHFIILHFFTCNSYFFNFL